MKVELNDIRKCFGAVKAVDNVSLEIPDRSRIAITGPSGSGKTTLLRLIAGLEMPDAGEVLLNDRVVSSPKTLVSPSDRGLGFVFQSPALWPHMTVAGNILFALHDTAPDSAQDRVNDLLERMAIPHLHDRYPDEISGGEARRVALARALAARPSTLLFDEPLTNLDDELKEELLTLIAENVKESNATMIFVTHNIHEAEAIADSVVRYDHGRIISKEL